MILNGAGRTHADNVLHAKIVEQLVGVDTDGGHTHAGGHDGYLDALVIAGVALHAPDIVHKDGIFQEILGDKLGPQGIAGHQYGLAEADVVKNIDMRGFGEVGHGNFLLIFW